MWSAVQGLGTVDAGKIRTVKRRADKMSDEPSEHFRTWGEWVAILTDYWQAHGKPYQEAVDLAVAIVIKLKRMTPEELAAFHKNNSWIQ
jgi:hypothetical protein